VIVLITEPPVNENAMLIQKAKMNIYLTHQVHCKFIKYSGTNSILF